MASISPRQHPQLSATQLADYLVSPTPIGRVGILRQAKYPSQGKPLVIQYQAARRCISACLCSPAETGKLAAASIAMLKQRKEDPSTSPLSRDDATRSIDIIEKFWLAQNTLDLSGITFNPPTDNPKRLSVNGVYISVCPDALAFTYGKKAEVRVGQAFIRCRIGESGDGAENRRSQANAFLTTIAHMHAAEFLEQHGVPHAPTSLVIDVPREKVVRGSNNLARRVANIQEACAEIAARWGDV